MQPEAVPRVDGAAGLWQRSLPVRRSLRPTARERIPDVASSVPAFRPNGLNAGA